MSVDESLCYSQNRWMYSRHYQINFEEKRLLLLQHECQIYLLMQKKSLCWKLMLEALTSPTIEWIVSLIDQVIIIRII